MTEENKLPNILPGDATKALLGLAMALIHEIKHHEGYDGERLVGTLRIIRAGLKPDTPGLASLMETFETMITQNMIFENKDDSANKT
jgi:hypothetical protein